MPKKQPQPSISMMRYQATNGLGKELDAGLATFDLPALEALRDNQELKQLRSAPLTLLMERIDSRLAVLKPVEAAIATPPAPRGPALDAAPKIQVQPAAQDAAPSIIPTDAPVTPVARGPVQSAQPLVRPSIEPRARTPEGRSQPQVI